MFKTLKIILLLISSLLGLTWPAAAAPPQQEPSPLTVFESMQQQTGGTLEVYWDEQTHVPRFLVGRIPTEKMTVSSAGLFDAEATARAFFHNFADLYQMRQPEAELALIKTTRDDLGMSHVRFRQEVNGVPVWGAVVVAHLDAAGQLTAINGEYIPNIALEVTPTLSLTEALAITRNDLGDQAAELFTDRSQLAIYARNHPPILAWQVNVFSENPLGNWLYFIDAHTGVMVHRLNQIETANLPGMIDFSPNTPITENIPDYQEIEPLAGKSIKTYDANYSAIILPGTLTCTNSNGTCPNGDADEQAAHQHASIVYDFYKNTFGLDSYDGSGVTMESSVHYGSQYNNAFWGVQTSGREFVVYGDGDGITMIGFARALDVVGHEFTHGLNWRQAGLIYQDQPGALQETYADVFGTLIEFYGDPTHADWLHAEDIYTPAIPGDARRDLSNPSNGAAGQWNPATLDKGQPDHMSLYIHLPYEQDQGGVHFNSGITNKAAYLISEGGAFHGINVAGIGRNNLGKIYFRALSHYLTPTSNFIDARNASIQACTDLFGSGHVYCNSVRNGFAAVGIGTPASFTQAVYLPLIMESGSNNSQACSPIGIYGRVTQNNTVVGGVSLNLQQCDQNAGTCVTQRVTTTANNGCYSFTNVSTLPPPINGIYPNWFYRVTYLNSSTNYNNRLYLWITDPIRFYATGDNVGAGNFDLADVVLVSPVHNNAVPFPVVFRWNIRNLAELYRWRLSSPTNELLFTAGSFGHNSYTLAGSPPGIPLNPAIFYRWTVYVSTAEGIGIPYYYRNVRFSQASSAMTTAEEVTSIPAWQVFDPDKVELWK